MIKLKYTSTSSMTFVFKWLKKSINNNITTITNLTCMTLFISDIFYSAGQADVMYRDLERPLFIVFKIRCSWFFLFYIDNITFHEQASVCMVRYNLISFLHRLEFNLQPLFFLLFIKNSFTYLNCLHLLFIDYFENICNYQIILIN